MCEEIEILCVVDVVTVSQIVQMQISRKQSTDITFAYSKLRSVKRNRSVSDPTPCYCGPLAGQCYVLSFQNMKVVKHFRLRNHTSCAYS